MSRLWESQTPLMAAIGAGRNEIVRLLLSAHADPNLQDGIGQTPLLLAVRSGNYESARLLLAQGARADLADALGDTPAYAAYERHDDQALLREILAAMPPQVRSNEASRLILIAANRNQIRDLELLLSLGGELSACTIYGESALSQACGPQNEETVVWLIQHGFPLHRKTLKDVSRVVELADVALQRAIQCGAAGCVGALLDAGIEVNHTIQGRPLLAYAVETGNHGMIQLLLERGANQRQKSAEGKLPVDFAANADVRSWLSATPVRPSSWPLPTTVSALSNSHSDFSRDADPLKKQVNSQLISACKRDDIPGAVEAISAGAEIDARDESGMTPLTHALKTRSFKTARWLIENGAAVNRLTKSQCAPLSFAIEANSPDLAAALLREGADPNLLGFRGFTPLMLAVRTGNRSMVDLLLDAGADANLAGWQSDFLYREPPLAGALAEGHADLVELLLTRGADSHAQSYSFLSTRTGIVKEPQPSLLMFAAAGGNLELVQRMIAFGQDPRFQDKENNDALAWAAGRGRDKVVEFLLPLVGHSPHALEMAYRSGKTSTIELLRRAGYQ
jgi:ankyrin repeat protein